MFNRLLTLLAASALAALTATSFAAAPDSSAYLSWSDGSGSASYTRPAVQDEEAVSAAEPVVTNVRDLTVSAQSALVVDAQSGKVLFEKNTSVVRSIASITKIITAMVVVDSRLDMHEVITLEAEDFVGAKTAGSNLRVGDRVNRAELLLLALMKSENPASKALARSHPEGYNGFIRLLNAKARSLGMQSAYFADSTGLSPRNVANAQDLVKMVQAASQYGVIRTFSSTPEYSFNLGNRVYHARNTNEVVREGAWSVDLSKTGYINEAGRCVVMQAKVNNKPAYIVLMGARSSQGRTGDAKRILGWLASFL